MTESMIVKSEYNGDIRRFAVPKISFTFKYVKTTISVLYQVSPENISMYSSKNGIETELVSDETLTTSYEATPGNGLMSRIIVRINEKVVPPVKPVLKEEKVPTQLPTLEVPIQLSDAFVVKLMEHPKVQDKICEIVGLILTDKKIINALAKKVTKRQNRNAKRLSFQLPNPRNNSEEHSQAEEVKNPIQEDELKDAVKEIIEESVRSEDHEKEDKEEVVQSEESKGSDIVSSLDVSNNSNNTKENKISDAIDAKLEAFSTSPIIQSFLSIFKPKAKEPKIVPEEMLKQLDEMGFTNRESNIEVLQFHTKFNEGIDAVLEDLLKRKEKDGEKAH